MNSHSMTAFAHQRSEYPWGSAIWEVRSVNHRYLELSFKLPESWRHLEPRLRDLLRKSLQRGKVECALKIQLQEQDSSLQVNDDIARQVINAAQHIANKYDPSASLDPLDILRWPGVIAAAESDGADTTEQLLTQFSSSLDEHLAHRQREGSALVALIDTRLDHIDQIVAELQDKMPAIITAQRQKLQQRLAELQVELNPERLEAEVALIAQKADVDEELDRLNTHVIEVRRVLSKGGASGRRLDFLMQELNREANTLSSKAVVVESTQAAVELKVLIEQMREQIQNIE